ncbi:SGNH/GDSL hydrolase family protein [Halomonas sp. HK25]|uniref:SGNH/GDSL hydrolase family protein n=1 Tax=Halomonas sp. HK25 TaxID=3394321 RepID=UPI0039FD100D
MKKKVIFGVYLFFVHLAIAVLLIKTDAIPRVLAKAGIVEPAQAYIELRHRVFQERRDPIVPPGAAVFLGDSITQGFVTSLVEPMSVNFGIGQQTTTQLIQSLPGYSSIHDAGAIYLMIGVNDIFLGKEDVLEARYKEILHLLPKDVPLIWSALMPVANRSGSIQRTNNIIKRLCDDRDRCVYVDTFGPLSNENGNPATGTMLDGVHPSNEGYQVWVNLLSNAKESPSK